MPRPSYKDHPLWQQAIGLVEEAYAVASVACDLRIHEVVDAPNWVVGCFVPRSILES